MEIEKVRAFISLLLVVIFFMLIFTGIGLWISPSGKIAKISSWDYFAMDKTTLKTVHFYAGILMNVLGCIHLILNYKLLKIKLKCVYKK